MKNTTTTITYLTRIGILLFVCLWTNSLQAQHDQHHNHGINHSCFSEDDKNTILAKVDHSVNALRAAGKLNKLNSRSTVSLRWPLRNGNFLNGKSNWGTPVGISNFVDQNPTNGLRDYNCGNHTYDGHNGIDIFTYPFGWYLMEQNAVEIIAAEAGVIIYKSDGNSSYSCDFNSTSNWNSVFIMHNDGSIAWYGHMKEGSPTAKTVGQYVSKGEYLGVVGSSGRSTGPHLHFEMYKGQPYTRENLIEPFIGSCNSLNNDDYWESQRPYKQPILAGIFTHDRPYEQGCHNNENPNFEDSFEPGDKVYFSRFYTDEEFNSTTNLLIRTPSGSVWQSWTHRSTSSYTASNWYNYYTLPTNAEIGTWTYTATYKGKTLTHRFKVEGNTQCDRPNKPTVTNLAPTTLTLKWNTVFGAVSYNLYYWRGSYWHKFNSTSTNFHNVSNLQPNTTYYFRVSTVCQYQESDLSNYINVKTPYHYTCNAPNRPTTNNITSTSFKVNWNQVSGATSYNVYLYDGSNWQYHANSTNNYYILENLSPSTKYFVAITSVCASGESSLSPYSSCTTKAPSNNCATPQSPWVSNLQSSTLTLNWNHSYGANLYELYYWTGSVWKRFASTYNNYYNVSNLSANATYYFCIRAKCSYGYSDLSNYIEIKTPSSYSCGKPSGLHATSVYGTECNLDWDNVYGADKYKLFYWYGGQWVSFGEVYSSSAKVTGLSHNTTYYFAVKAFLFVKTQS